MKFRISLKDAGLTALGVVLLLLLYCFASNGRYERVEGGVYGNNVDNRMWMYGDGRLFDVYDYVYLDTWRGRLCYFGEDGKKRYIKEDD